MSARVQRAMILLDQSRTDLAEKELRAALVDDPDHPLAHALLALCLVDGEDYQTATKEAKEAIRLAPDMPMAHTALACALVERNRFEDATVAIQEAIRLDPENSFPFGVLATIHLQQDRWKQALVAAEQGLSLDPKDLKCINARAMALVKLGKKQEANDAIQGTLALDPEDEVSHANMGWTLLHQRRYAQALEHFREALRIDPQNDWARNGVVLALKAKNRIYGLLLRYFLWMASLSGKAKWGVILGGYFGARILRNVAGRNEALAPFLMPIIALYVLFVLLTWIGEPLFTLLLRINRYGRMVLSKKQIADSNWLGGFLLAGLLMLLCGLITGIPSFLPGSLIVGLLLVPLGGTLSCPSGWPKRLMTIYMAVLTLLGLWITGLCFRYVGQPAVEWTKGYRAIVGSFFFIGIFAAPWLAVAISAIRPKR